MIDAVVLAGGLAMDATAVAAARGAAGMGRAGAVRMAVIFGVFQAGMAAIGWAAGAGAERWIAEWDHWLAFGLLAVIGGKMLVEAVRRGDGEAAKVPGWSGVLVLAVATSIDALAAGVTLPLIAAPPVVSLALIGVVTLVLSLAGAWAGGALGARLGRGLEVVGGIALIAIGVKIVIDHTSAAEPPVPEKPAVADTAPPPPFRALDAARLDDLAAAEVPGFVVVARDRTATSLVVSLRAEPLRALVTVGPCLACRSMDPAGWREALPELRQLMPGALEDDPSTRFELVAVDVGGHRCIQTWELGAVTYDEEVVASHAARLYCNDGATELVVRVDDDAVASAHSPEAAHASAHRDAVEAAAHAVAEAYLARL